MLEIVFWKGLFEKDFLKNDEISGDSYLEVFIDCVVFLLDAQFLHLFSQTVKKAEFLFNVGNLDKLLGPNRFRNEEICRQESTLVYRFLNQMHKEKWAQRLFIRYSYIMIFLICRVIS